MNKFNKQQQQWGCGSIILAVIVICGAAMLLPRLFGSGDNVDDVNTPDAIAQNEDTNIVLGPLVISEDIDRDGCPVNEVNSLENSSRFYVVAPNSAIPAGTDVFVRLYRDGVAVEDLPLITADQDYSNTCLNFVFETVDGNDFESGQYTAEFWVNGNSYSSIDFDID
jgi:hypothetical protein